MLKIKELIRNLPKELQNYYRIKEFKKSLEEGNLKQRHYSGLIIASSFSMMILLLTFIKERTLILEIGIGALLISILLQYILYGKSNEIIGGYQYTLNNYVQDYSKKVNKIIYYFMFGEFSFFIGIVFILFFFNLHILSLLILSYLIYRNFNLFKVSIKALKAISLINDIPNNIEQNLWDIFKRGFTLLMKHQIISGIIQIIIIVIVIISTFNYLYFLLFI